MQERDEARIETKLMRDAVSMGIEKGIEKKFGCDIDVQIHELNAVNMDGKLHLHLNLVLKATTQELEKILGSWGSAIFPLLKMLNGNFAQKYIINNVLKLLKKLLTKKLDCDVDIQIHELKYASKGEKKHIYFNADAEMKTEELEALCKV